MLSLAAMDDQKWEHDGNYPNGKGALPGWSMNKSPRIELMRLRDIVGTTAMRID
jgi:hypothetical protein